jgi:predicted nucleic acid-binding protein
MQALATASMGAELADVLARPFVQGWNVAPAAVFDAWRGCVQLVEAPAGQSPWPPRCSDGDDQKFIDLAWHGSAAWLFSRDRAVLKLARAARLRGLRIATPETWLDAVQA